MLLHCSSGLRGDGGRASTFLAKVIASMVQIASMSMRGIVNLELPPWKMRVHRPATRAGGFCPLLANRACGVGEGPAAYHHVPRSRAPRYEAPEPPEDRPRRDALLRRLLLADVDRYYSTILQCVRYIVATDFFRLEKVPPPPSAQLGPSSSTSAQVVGSSSSAPDKDLKGASQAGPVAGIPRVELEDEELLELAKVLDV